MFFGNDVDFFGRRRRRGGCGRLFFMFCVVPMILFAGLIKCLNDLAYEYATPAVPVTPMSLIHASVTEFHTLSPTEKARLIDLTELAGQASDSLKKLALQKGYQLVQPFKKIDGDLYHALLQKGNTLFVVFHVNCSDIGISNEQWDDLFNPHRGKETVEQLLAHNPKLNVGVIGYSAAGAMVQYVLREIDSKRLWGCTVNSCAFPNGISGGSSRLIDIVHEADPAQLYNRSQRLLGKGILVRGLYNKLDNDKWSPGFDLTGDARQHSIESTWTNMMQQQAGVYTPPAMEQVEIPRVKPPKKTMTELLDAPAQNNSNQESWSQRLGDTM